MFIVSYSGLTFTHNSQSLLMVCFGFALLSIPNAYMKDNAQVEYAEPLQKDEETRVTVPKLLVHLSAMFPMGIGRLDDTLKYQEAIGMLLDCLPPMPRAWNLLETYMEGAAAIFQPTKRDHLIDDFLIPVYDAKKGREYPGANVKPQVSSHKIAFLFLVFSSGATVDFTMSPDDEEGERYYHFARAALTLRSVCDSPMMETVQAVMLLAIHRYTAGELYSRDSAWTLLGIACKLALSVSHKSRHPLMISNICMFQLGMRGCF